MLLGLPAIDELIIMENLEIFKKNGFEFEIDEDAQVSGHSLCSDLRLLSPTLPLLAW